LFFFCILILTIALSSSIAFVLNLIRIKSRERSSASESIGKVTLITTGEVQLIILPRNN
jgi:hypothetical protein